MSIKLFCYGTLLLPSNVLYKVLVLFSNSVTPAYLNGKLFSVGEYPFPFAAKTDDNESLIFGKIFDLKEPKLLEIIDQYEGYDEKNDFNTNFYIREKHEVIDMFGEKTEAWVYFMNPDVEMPDCDEIVGGDYIEYVTKEMLSIMDS
jgi:gamma-glutamylcyclotransferase (GGCT)/AIG2-like uncharacterized protein YtfP